MPKQKPEPPKKLVHVGEARAMDGQVLIIDLGDDYPVARIPVPWDARFSFYPKRVRVTLEAIPDDQPREIVGICPQPRSLRVDEEGVVRLPPVSETAAGDLYLNMPAPVRDQPTRLAASGDDSVNTAPQVVIDQKYFSAISDGVDHWVVTAMDHIDFAWTHWPPSRATIDAWKKVLFEHGDRAAEFSLRAILSRIPQEEAMSKKDENKHDIVVNFEALSQYQVAALALECVTNLEERMGDERDAVLLRSCRLAKVFCRDLRDLYE